jgi:hypothetical protein
LVVGPLAGDGQPDQYRAESTTARTPAPRREFCKMRIAIIFGLFLFGAPAVAEENLSLFQNGALSCMDWNRPPDFANAGVKAWMLRYGSRLGAQYTTNIFDKASQQTSLQWIGAYCKAHPLSGLSAAGVELMNALGKGI